MPDFEVDKPHLVDGLGAEFKWDGKCRRIAKIFVEDPSNEGERSPLHAPGVDVIVDDHGAVVRWPLVIPGVTCGAWKEGGACL